MEFLKAFCVFLLFGLAISAKDNRCPVSTKVRPCRCYDGGSGRQAHLKCAGIKSTDDLRKVFINSKGTRYSSVEIINLDLDYIPRELFEGVEVKKLKVHNGRLDSLFDGIPSGNVASLRYLYIENAQIYRGVEWKLLQSMTNLRKLNIKNANRVKALGKDFAQYAPKSLLEIELDSTSTTEITEGAFKHFSHLVKVVISHSPLKELNRNIFPVPFNAKYLVFEGIQLTSLPDDMFSNMPNLEQVTLSRNRLTTIPRYSSENLQYFDLTGNPLYCDCHLAWIAGKNVVKGTCSSPEKLKGKGLKETYKDMHCL